MRSCFILAGEKSGEEHALTFFSDLKKRCPETHFFGVGGEELAQNGVELIYHLKDFSSMGFSEVVGKIPFYFSALKKIEEEVDRRETKVAILIDFQDFNLRLAKKLSQKGVKILYYVAPQAWAWKSGRASKIAKYAQTLFTILPFEKKWFQERGVRQVKSIPHPIMERYADDIINIQPKMHKTPNDIIKLLLLPGSRSFEVLELLPIFIESIRLLKKDFKIETHLVKVEHLSPKIYEFYDSEIDVLHSSSELTKAMKECDFSLAASGTVTLATGVYELPTVVCYKASLLNEFIFKNFIKYKGYISLTNLIHERLVFPELIQSEVTPQKIQQLIKVWINEKVIYNNLKNILSTTRLKLQGENFSVPEYMAGIINGK